MKLYNIVFAATLGLSMSSCSDWLEQEPVSQISPDGFMTTESRIQAAVNQFYTDILPAHAQWSYGQYGTDTETDNQVDLNPSDKYGNGLWKVASSNSNWSWTNVRNVNYWLNDILTMYQEGKISGTEANIRQYIGELYFLRAYAYFTLYKKFGDLPIVTEALPDDEATLVAANERKPRNEVARFILGDLDNAISYLVDGFESKHTRISRDAALVFKSRVALFEASWLQNFKGTAFVPGGNGWPGASKSYNSNFSYQSGSIDSEISYFYTQCVNAAQEVAEKYKNQLVVNTGTVPQSESDPVNPYLAMWGTTDMSATPEVLLWRQYDNAIGANNCVEVALQTGNYGTGLTRSMVEGYLMADGKPIYASDYTYSDNTIAEARSNRDPRLVVFLKEPGQRNWFKNPESTADHGNEIEQNPDITSHVNETGYVTGYVIRKGGTFDKAECNNGGCSNALSVFRATEALLNYMEAQYQLTGDINSGNILSYWRIVRTSAGFTGDAIDPMVTINATDMSRETLDWGAYTAGKLLDDKVLYNIRRERRSEFIAEGMREMDLLRWRSFDQLMTNPCHIEGMHLWGTTMEGWYNNLVADGSSTSNTSARSLSEYIRPHEINMTNNNFVNGLTWHMAHYLDPLPVRQFLLTATDHASVDQSTLYQNPYWPTVAGESAQQ